MGGTRSVSALAHRRARRGADQVKRRQAAPTQVDPLPDAPAPQQPPEPSAEQVAACVDIDALRTMHRVSGPERRAQIEARVQALKDEPTEGDA